LLGIRSKDGVTRDGLSIQHGNYGVESKAYLIAIMKQQHKMPNIRLYYDSIPIAICKACHFDSLGMRIDAGMVYFPKYTPLEVEVFQGEGRSQPGCRFPAVVSACSREGMRLIVTGSDASMLEKWQAMIMSFLIQKPAS